MPPASFRLRRWAASFCGVLLLACGNGSPQTTTGASPGGSAAPCMKFGDRCSVAPGKLGTCVERPGCTAGDCFVCQSQH